MKLKFSKYIIATIIILSTLFFSSCNEDDIMTFNKEMGLVDFNHKTEAYSFLKSGKDIDTLNIKFLLHGVVTSSDREAKITVIEDSTTISVENFEIISTILLANEDFGFVKVRVVKPENIGDEDLYLYLRAVSNDNFDVGIEDDKNCKIQITNKLLPPSYWTPTGWISKWYLGNYSTAYYKFIIKETGIEDFPYPYPINGVKWNSAEAEAFIAMLKGKLRAYNESISPEVLLHDDGIAKSMPVVVGKYYKN